MSNMSIERGAPMPAQVGYEASRSLNGPAVPVGFEEHPPDVIQADPRLQHLMQNVPVSAEPGTLKSNEAPAGGIAAAQRVIDAPETGPTAEQVAQAALLFSTNYVSLNVGMANYASYDVMLSEEEHEAIQLILARAVARQLDEEKQRVLATVQLPQRTGKAVQESGGTTDVSVQSMPDTIPGESGAA